MTVLASTHKDDNGIQDPIFIPLWNPQQFPDVELESTTATIDIIAYQTRLYSNQTARN